jgi:N-acetylglucosaminyldiphosphoundecaprenol N-acetyl-beta-D-mannosaminyltransferase
MERKQILNINVSMLSYQAVLAQIVSLAQLRIPSYVCFANAHMLVEGYYSSYFAQLVNRAAIVAADGMPIAKAFKWLYGIHQERVAGMDMMASIITECSRRNISIFFLAPPVPF